MLLWTILHTLQAALRATRTHASVSAECRACLILELHMINSAAPNTCLQGPLLASSGRLIGARRCASDRRANVVWSA